MKKLIISIIVFLILYRPKISYFIPKLYIPVILLVLLFILFKHGELKVKLNSIPVKSLVSISLITLYLFIIVDTNSGDYIVFENLLWLFLSFLCSIFLYATYKDYLNENLPQVLFSVAFFQSMVCIAMFLIPSLREFYSAIGTSAEDRVNQLDLVRNYGIAGANEYIFGIGLIHGLIALLYIDRHIGKFAVIDFLKVLILLIPSIFDARIGLFCFAASMVSYMILKQKSRISINSVLWFLGFVVIVSVLGFVVLFVFRQYFSEYYAGLLMLLDALSALISGDTQAKVYEWYGGLMPGNWVLPEGIYLWFGKGEVPTNLTYMYAGVNDSGYYRIIWYGGIVLLILAIGCLFLSLKIFSKEKKKQLLALDLSIFLFILVATAKGNAMVQSAFMSTVLLIAINNMEHGRTIEKNC